MTYLDSNFGLFLNFIFKSDLTFFMDDDMVSCVDSSKISMCFFDYVQKTCSNSESCIIGSTLWVFWMRVTLVDLHILQIKM